MSALSAEERQIVDLVAQWVDGQVRPVVRDLEPDAVPLPEAMRQWEAYNAIVRQGTAAMTLLRLCSPGSGTSAACSTRRLVPACATVIQPSSRVTPRSIG